MLCKFKSLLLFISLEIDFLYGLYTQKNLHLHDQMSGRIRHCIHLAPRSSSAAGSGNVDFLKSLWTPENLCPSTSILREAHYTTMETPPEHYTITAWFGLLSTPSPTYITRNAEVAISPEHACCLAVIEPIQGCIDDTKSSASC